MLNDDELEEEYQAKRAAYLKNQAPRLKKCKDRSTCLGIGDCPLEAFNDEPNKICCPNGLPGYHAECLICEDCEYLEYNPELTPWDEEVEVADCDWFRIISADEENEDE